MAPHFTHAPPVLVQLKRKQDLKYDHDLEAELREWMEEKLGKPIGDDFQKALKSGVKLCRYGYGSGSMPDDFLSTETDCPTHDFENRP